MKKRFLLMVLTISGHGQLLIGSTGDIPVLPVISAGDLPSCEDACANEEPFRKGTIVCKGEEKTFTYFRKKESCLVDKREKCGQKKKCQLSCVKAQKEPCSGWFRLVEKHPKQKSLKPTPAANTDIEETTAAE